MALRNAFGNLALDATVQNIYTWLQARLGAKSTANSVSVNIANDQTVPVSAASLPLPSGAATSANQSTANSSLSSIDGKLPALSSGRVPVDAGEVEIKNDAANPVPVSGTVTATGPLTDTQLRATAVPVSAASLPLPTGAATQTTLANIDTQLDAGISVYPETILGKFREAFESFTPGVNWSLTTGSNDIVQLDGNAVSASYLVISKDPLTAATETALTTIDAFEMPFEIAVGLGMSQRNLGQELAVELISTTTPLTPPAELEISSISQATTTLTVNTTTSHNLVPGTRIGIYGVSDSRLNYASLVVASIPSETQFTCTATPGGTIASVTAGPYSGGYVYPRPSLGYATDGFSQLFETSSATSSSFYTRSNSGDALPSGTASGNHAITTTTTAGTQAINAAYTYAWLPASERRYVMQADLVHAMDVAVDSTGAVSSRVLRTQVIPDPSKQYKLRFRFANNKGLTVPTAKIVSAVKSGSTTATITTDVAHGLTVNDRIVIYGIRNQTSFANLTTATQVVSVPSSTTFTIAFGASATATSYGGMVARVQGGNIPTSFTTVAIQTATNDGSSLTLVGSANWGFSVGDYVNVYGCRDDATGADLGVDGVYKVASVATTTAILLPIGSTVLPASFAATNSGGTVVKRTDARISFVRIFDYIRERVEMASPASSALAVPAYITGFGSSVGIISNQNISLSLTRLVADVTSAALTSTATTSALTPDQGIAYSVSIPVTAVSGTNPTLDISIEESDDSGTNWFKVYDFPRITATGIYRSPIIRLVGNRVRYVQTLGGTSPSFTRAINRLQSNTNSEPVRQLIDRSIVLTTLNSTTPNLDTRDCGNRVQLVVNVGAITTTAPALQLEGSDDNGASWYAIGTPLTAVASSTVQLTVGDINSALVRARVSTAGSGVTAGYVMIKAHD